MTKVNHDLRSNQGRTIYMPEYYDGENGWGNLAMPNIYTTDDATATYPRATKFVSGERVFKYGTYRGVLHYTGDTVVTTAGTNLGGKFLFSHAYIQDMANPLLVRQLENEESVVFNTTVSDARSNDYYSGGWIAGYASAPSTDRPFFRRIVKHTYQSGTGTKADIFNAVTEQFTSVDLSSYSNVSILELDQPSVHSKTSLATGIMQEPYKLIVWVEDDAYDAYRQCIGAITHNHPTVNSSQWYQTWGPMYTLFYSAEAGGASARERVVMLMSDGSIQIRTDNDDRMDDHHEVIGYVMGDTVYNAATSGVAEDETIPMIFCTLSR